MDTVFTKNDNSTFSVSVSGTITSSNYPDGFTRENIKSVIIGTDVTIIGNSAFFGCSALQSVTIPNSVTTIGDDAFYGCTALQSVTIPNSVTSISNAAFFECSALDNIYPQGIDALSLTLDTIGDDVFSGTTIGNFSLPDTLTSIGNDALRGSNIDT